MDLPMPLGRIHRHLHTSVPVLLHGLLGPTTCADCPTTRHLRPPQPHPARVLTRSAKDHIHPDGLGQPHRLGAPRNLVKIGKIRKVKKNRRCQYPKLGGLKLCDPTPHLPGNARCPSSGAQHFSSPYHGSAHLSRVHVLHQIPLHLLIVVHGATSNVLAALTLIALYQQLRPMVACGEGLPQPLLVLREQRYAEVPPHRLLLDGQALTDDLRCTCRSAGGPVNPCRSPPGNLVCYWDGPR